jgi:hypothetical protein
MIRPREWLQRKKKVNDLLPAMICPPYLFFALMDAIGVVDFGPVSDIVGHDGGVSEFLDEIQLALNVCIGQITQLFRMESVPSKTKNGSGKKKDGFYFTIVSPVVDWQRRSPIEDP